MEFKIPDGAETVLKEDSYSYLSLIYGALARHCVGVLEARRPTPTRENQVEQLNGYLRRLPSNQNIVAQAADDHTLLVMADRIDHEAYRVADEQAFRVNS